jgi:hypothetical protein
VNRAASAGVQPRGGSRTGVGMQFIESSIVGVRSAVLTLACRTSPLRFVLFPMVHVGEPAFYREVTNRVRDCAIIVAEGSPAGSRPAQERMSRIRADRLVDQIVALDLASLGIPIFWEYAAPQPKSRAERIAHAAEDSAGAVALRLVDRRDDALNRRLTALHHEHRERPITVAVVYGAGHMPAVVEHLRGEYRYHVDKAEWLVVVNAPG